MNNNINIRIVGGGFIVTAMGNPSRESGYPYPTEFIVTDRKELIAFIESTLDKSELVPKFPEEP